MFLNTSSFRSGTRNINGFYQATSALTNLLQGKFLAAAQGSGGALRTLLSAAAKFPLATGVAVFGAITVAVLKKIEAQAEKTLRKTRELTTRFMEASRAARLLFESPVDSAARKAKTMEESGDIEGAYRASTEAYQKLIAAQTKYKLLLEKSRETLQGGPPDLWWGEGKGKAEAEFKRRQNRYFSQLKAAQREWSTAKEIYEIYRDIDEQIRENSKGSKPNASDFERITEAELTAMRIDASRALNSREMFKLEMRLLMARAQGAADAIRAAERELRIREKTANVMKRLDLPEDQARGIAERAVELEIKADQRGAAPRPGGVEIPADRFARIGGFIGGGGPSVQYARETAASGKLSVRTLNRIENILKRPPNRVSAGYWT